jgi:hypothetical protein
VAGGEEVLNPPRMIFISDCFSYGIKSRVQQNVQQIVQQVFMAIYANGKNVLPLRFLV